MCNFSICLYKTVKGVPLAVDVFGMGSTESLHRLQDEDRRYCVLHLSNLMVSRTV